MVNKKFRYVKGEKDVEAHRIGRGKKRRGGGGGARVSRRDLIHNDKGVLLVYRSLRSFHGLG